MGIPIFALIVASTMSAGGVDGMLIMLEGVVRTTITSVVDFVRGTLLGDSAGRQQRIISMAHDQIRLDDLLARDVSVQWFEGVALVQALCRQLSAASGSDGVFPGASQITLLSDGTVTFEGEAATRAVPAAGHLLARMLSDDAPVRLRLMVTQATADDATSGGLHEFSESLAYFERPNPERHPERAPRKGNRGAFGATAGDRDRRARGRTYAPSVFT